MSFLNSIISSIGEKDGAGTTPGQNGSTLSTRPAAKPSTAAISRPSQQTSSSIKQSSAGVEGRETNRKVDHTSLTPATKPSTKPGSSLTANTASRSLTTSPAPRPAASAPKVASVPYRGTSRPSGQDTTAQKATITKSTGLSPPKSTGNNATKSTAANMPKLSATNGLKPTGGSNGTGTQPVTGSKPKTGYLAMLEKAKAAQEASKPVGQIKHQKVEKPKLSRREKERLAAEAAAAAKKGSKGKQMLNNGERSRTGTPTDGKPAKPKIDIGYKGTMRPTTTSSQSSYKGTMRPASAPSGSGSAKRKQGPNQSRYRYADEDDEDDADEQEEEEEGYDDYDSASSDMEAGIDEIDREELSSAKLAKKEDEEALREEERHRREKLERKRKLEALSAAASKRKKVY